MTRTGAPRWAVILLALALGWALGLPPGGLPGVARADEGAGEDEAPPPAEPVAQPEAADVELYRPIFGVRAMNRTVRKRKRREKYLWRDHTGKEWTRYREVPDGEAVTLYVRVTAIDIPRDVMGATSKLILSDAAGLTSSVFPVRTLPWKVGDYRNEQMVIHVPQDVIDREGGNWLRKVTLENVTRLISVRPGAVRFMDGTRAVYEEEPTIPADVRPPMVEPDDPEFDRERPLPGTAPYPGAPPAVGPVPTPAATGRVWIRPYYRKDGTFVRGHWRYR